VSFMISDRMCGDVPDFGWIFDEFDDLGLEFTLFLRFRIGCCVILVISDEMCCDTCDMDSVFFQC